MTYLKKVLAELRDPVYVGLLVLLAMLFTDSDLKFFRIGMYASVMALFWIASELYAYRKAFRKAAKKQVRQILEGQ